MDNSALWIAVISTIGTVCGGLLAYWTSKINKKYDLHKINTEQSNELFEEYKSLVDSMHVEIGELKKKIQTLDKKVEKYEKDVQYYIATIYKKDKEIYEKDVVIRDLEKDNLQLSEINKQLTTENIFLKQELNDIEDSKIINDKGEN